MKIGTHFNTYSSGKYGLPHMGEVIADYRERKGYSQEVFAVVCGMDKQSIVYWENQVYLSDMERRIFLHKVLSIPPTLLGLTWRSVVDKDREASYVHDYECETALLKENAYGLYEDVLELAHTGPNRYAPTATYKFLKHQQELVQLVKKAPEIEKDSWRYLLSRYYQHSAFIAQHYKNDKDALSYINHSLEIISSLKVEDVELKGTALYKRARIHLLHNQHTLARQDISNALDMASHVRGPLKGSVYLMAAEMNSFYVQGDEKLRTQCRKWQETAANLIYKGKVEPDETFLWFNLYAVHHERAKTLARFAFYYVTDEELVGHLKGNKKADIKLVHDDHDALVLARTHLDNSIRQTGTMDYHITEARILLIEREFEESAKSAKRALSIARAAHTKQGEVQVRKLYSILNAVDPKSPHIIHLGIGLGIY